MRWWRRLRETVWWLDHAAWPGGVPWPEGHPRFIREKVASILAGLAVIGAAVGLSGLGVPEVVVIAVGLLGITPVALYIIWCEVSEAKRQGWGSNLR